MHCLLISSEELNEVPGSVFGGCVSFFTVCMRAPVYVCASVCVSVGPEK